MIPEVAPHTSSEDVPVVVVGAGPAGLVAAITLARAGIACTVLSRHTGVNPQPRATLISVRSMELLRSWGLDDAVRAGGDEVQWRLRLTSTLANAADGQSIDVGVPTDAESADLSPTRPAGAPQDHLETVLLDHLRTFPTARIRLGALVHDIERHPGGVRVRYCEAGVERSVDARYLIGADGARSVVRQRLGIGARTTEPTGHAMAVVIHAPLWDVVGEHRYGIYWAGQPPHGATFLPAGHGDRWVYSIFLADPDERNCSEPELIAGIRAASGRSDLPVRIAAVNRFAFSAAIADRFRSVASFLVGDAAHRVTPRGGTGMNTAVAGAYNLGWKLAWVLRGWAPESLLDSYEDERRPIAEHNFRRSIDPDGSRRSTAEELPVDLGGRIPHRWVDADREVSTLDLLGPGLTWFGVPGAFGALRHRPAVAAPVTERVLTPATVHALGADSSGGLLVRPDGLVWNEALARSSVWVG
jgi:putative polyketide hydroxylase